MGKFTQPPRSANDAISLQEIEQVLADTGYSADQRSGWIKEVLTDLEQSYAKAPNAEKRELIRSVKQVLNDYQGSGRPISDDVL